MQVPDSNGGGKEWAGTNLNTDETFRVAPAGRFPGVRLVVPRSLRSRGRGYGHLGDCHQWETNSRKWAGTNLNRGYGHPKAEGYQATPPARSVTQDTIQFNGCETPPFWSFPPGGQSVSSQLCVTVMAWSACSASGPTEIW